MATITESGSYLILNISGVNRLSIPKGKVSMSVSGNNLLISYNGKYEESFAYTDVSDPSTASAEALRAEVITLLT